jgi:outer membrane receptor protein involved in Fe transport
VNRHSIATIILLFVLSQATFGQVPAPTAGPTGRIVGRVIDRESGRPIQLARITVVDGPTIETDLDGRYRTVALPVGMYTIRAAAIGYAAGRVDSVRVVAGQATTADLSLTARVMELEELTVAAEAPKQSNVDAGLLAMQQAAPAASDGISAEAIKRSPDADAGDAVRRVTGVSLIDDRFVVIRGLNERYSNSQLNGAELASPEPLKKVTPLDIFPSSLLESIIATKVATPDKPGDFAGGSIDIRTKEFPDNPVLQLSMSQGWNSLSTFETFTYGTRTASDFFGYDNGRRSAPSGILRSSGTLGERTAESIRNVWSPGANRALPNLGFGVNIGGQQSLGSTPLGYIASFNYSSKTSNTPERLFRFFSGADAPPGRGFLSTEGQASVDWGAMLNLSTRLGMSSKLSWKNLLTRNAEETFVFGSGFTTEREGDFREYGVRYVEREFLQTQLAGEHVLGFLFQSRLDWKATLGRARRDEPDSRSIRYTRDQTPDYRLNNIPGNFWFRQLEDRILTGQLDWSFPVSLRRSADALLKVGLLRRDKERAFDAQLVNSFLLNTPEASAVAPLPPDLAFAPENIGSIIEFRAGGQAQGYESDDDLTAAYGMVDLSLFTGVRLVGGVRYEDWQLHLFEGSRDSALAAEYRRNRDYLWSSSLTLSLSDRMNLRFGGFRSVSRPDPREVALDEYSPVGGECSIIGNPDLERATILNGDARWEYYPSPGEFLSVSGFYKKFDDPIIETVELPGSNACRIRSRNATDATSYGAEFEVRKNLVFLPGLLSRLSAGVNLTLVSSRVAIDPNLGDFDSELDLQGQSPMVLNGNLTYTTTDSRFSGSVLFNYFEDRVARYGVAITPGIPPLPSIIERGRQSLDAKVSHAFGGFSFSLGARNLTNERVEFFQESSTGPVLTGAYAVGVTWSLGITYDF